MSTTFSVKNGFVKPKQIQRDQIDEQCKISLWNALYLNLFQPHSNSDFETLDILFLSIWVHIIKHPVENIMNSELGDKIKSFKDWFFLRAEWYMVYDVLEYIVENYADHYPSLSNALNVALGDECSAWRFVNNKLVEIVGKEEISVVEVELHDDTFPGVKAHLSSALNLLSIRPTPEYRNSIKESISAVESIAQVITGKPKATLSEALKSLFKEKALHPALQGGFDKLYGYTSNEGGIRHAMLDKPDLGAAEARYFLLSCTSFINYLKSKM